MEAIHDFLLADKILPLLFSHSLCRLNFKEGSYDAEQTCFEVLCWCPPKKKKKLAVKKISQKKQPQKPKPNPIPMALSAVSWHFLFPYNYPLKLELQLPVSFSEVRTVTIPYTMTIINLLPLKSCQKLKRIWFCPKFNPMFPCLTIQRQNSYLG